MCAKIIDAALEMADNGLPVFPVTKHKTPAWSVKLANLKRGQGGLKMASTDPDEVERLFTDPRVIGKITGIGMPTGKISNVTVVDVDCGKGKPHRDSAREWLEKNRANTLWGATVVRTGSGGLHYYCRYTPDVTNSASIWADGVDCRNDGGYVVVPPFMGYSFERQTEQDDWPLPPPVPAKRRRDLPKKETHNGQVPPEIIEMARLIREKVTWHEPVRDIIAHLVGSGWEDAEILRYCFQWSWPGYNPRDTFETMCIMIAGARAKWSRDQQADTIEAHRLNRMANDWRNLSPEARRIFHANLKGTIT